MNIPELEINVAILSASKGMNIEVCGDELEKVRDKLLLLLNFYSKRNPKKKIDLIKQAKVAIKAVIENKIEVGNDEFIQYGKYIRSIGKAPINKNGENVPGIIRRFREIIKKGICIGDTVIDQNKNEYIVKDIHRDCRVTITNIKTNESKRSGIFRLEIKKNPKERFKNGMKEKVIALAKKNRIELSEKDLNDIKRRINNLSEITKKKGGNIDNDQIVENAFKNFKTNKENKNLNEEYIEFIKGFKKIPVDKKDGTYNLTIQSFKKIKKRGIKIGTRVRDVNKEEFIVKGFTKICRLIVTDPETGKTLASSKSVHAIYPVK